MGLQRRGCAGSNVTIYSQDASDKSRHQCICLAASISRKMDSWTFLSPGFDVGEEADGRSRTTAALRDGRDWEGVGQHWGGEIKIWWCVRRKRARGGWDKRDTLQRTWERKTWLPQHLLVFKHLPVPACAEGEQWLFDSITLLLQL